MVALIYANQNICIQQACKQTGIYSHSKQILNHFKNFSLDEIKCFFFHSALAMLNLSIKKLNLRDLKLAVDITEDDYYGKLDNPYIWNRNPAKVKNGTTEHFKYLTISVTNSNCKLILFNLMLGTGYNVEDIILLALTEIRKFKYYKNQTTHKFQSKYIYIKQFKFKQNEES